MFLGPDPIGRRWTGAGLGPRLCPGAFPALLVARRRVTVAPGRGSVAWRGVPPALPGPARCVLARAGWSTRGRLVMSVVRGTADRDTLSARHQLDIQFRGSPRTLRLKLIGHSCPRPPRAGPRPGTDFWFGLCLGW